MAILDKLVGLATVGGVIANASSFHRFLTGLTTVLALAVIGTLLGGILVVGGFAALYFGLVYFGLPPFSAAFIVALLMLASVATIFFVVVIRLRQLGEITHKSMQSRLPGVAHITSVIDAFLDGLLKSGNRSKG